ncbi:MAG: fused MFS/spermidine synthase [Sterolibacterium sp.]
MDVPNPFIAAHGWLRLMEPVDTPIQKLQTLLLDGTYRRPFILEDGQLRKLLFEFTHVQSVMTIDAPDTLTLRYTQMMMGFLLFQPNPANVLLLGLGGGSLAKYCYWHLPLANITVIEIDSDVMALRGHFMVPKDNARFRVIHGDGAQHVGAQEEPVDVLLVDAFDGKGMAKSVADRDFLQTAYNCLAVDGVLGMNLASDKARYKTLVADAQSVFDHQVHVILVSDDRNHILFALKNPQFVPNWRSMKLRAKELKKQYQLDFPAMVQKMERALCAGKESKVDSL